MAKATAPKTTRSCKVIASTEAGEINQSVLRTKAVIDHSWPMLATLSPVLVASSVENWAILRETVLRKRKTIHLFTAATKRQPQSPRPFSGMAIGDLNAETIFVEQDELFLHDSNIDELGDLNAGTFFAGQEELFLHDSNIDEKSGTFLFDPKR